MSMSRRPTTPVIAVTTQTDDDSASLCAAVSRGLGELAGVLRTLTDQQYTAVVPAVGPSPIGAHVRHAIDHVTNLVECVTTSQVDYDCRCRGTPVEHNRAAAIATLDELVSSVASLATRDPQFAVTVNAIIAVDGPSVPVASTLGREMVFVLSHTIHHNAAIASMARAFECELPEGFGWAPSTLRHAMNKSCAQ